MKNLLLRIQDRARVAVCYTLKSIMLSEKQSYNQVFTEILVTVETGRKGEDEKWAGPATIGGSWSSRGISQLPRVLLKKHGVSTPSWTPKPKTPKTGKDAHITSDCEKLQGLCPLEREMTLLEAQASSYRTKVQNFICSHSYWILVQRGWSRLETCKGTLGFVVLGRELKEQPPESLCWVTLLHSKCHLSQEDHSPPCSISLALEQ